MTLSIWTAERELLLRKLWVQEVHINDILVLLNRISSRGLVPTTKAIQRKAERLQLPRRPGRVKKLMPKLTEEFSEIKKNIIDDEDVGEDYVTYKILKKQEKVKMLLLNKKEPFEIATEYNIPLREVYRMAAELRQQK